MTGGESGSSSDKGKRVIPEDLDKPIQDDWNVDLPITMVSTSSEGTSKSKSHKRPKKPDAHEKRPEYPPKEYTNFLRPVAMAWYQRRTWQRLVRQYFLNNEDGYVALSKDMCIEFMDRLEESEQFNNYQDYWLSPEWLNWVVTAMTNNVVKQGFEVVYKHPSGEAYTDDELKLLRMLEQVQAECQKYSRKHMKNLPWREEAERDLIKQKMAGAVAWLPRSAKIVEQPGQKFEGAEGTVRKVRIARVISIPPDVDFAGKRAKVESMRQKREQVSLEAMVCPVVHPGVIKISFINQRDYEGYTLWWNGGSLWNFERRINSKISEAMEYDGIKFQEDSGLTLDERTMVLTYRKNRVHLAMALLMIMEACHEGEIIHNDLSLQNVLLHFPPMDKTKVFIGVCDWGRCSRAKDEEPSRYGKQSLRELSQMKTNYKHVAPELFYAFGAPNSDMSLEKMQKKHFHSKGTDSYAAGWIAQWIWRDEYDPEYFNRDAGRVAYFQTQLQSLQHKDPSQRRTISEALAHLTGAPYFFKLPTTCFRETI